jgi:hypothetical protein
LPDLSKSDVSSIADVYTIVQKAVMANMTASQMQLIPDEAVGDPASLGNAVLLASQMKGTNSSQLMHAVEDQIQALFNAPRAASGAISQRQDEVQVSRSFTSRFES